MLPIALNWSIKSFIGPDSTKHPPVCKCLFVTAATFGKTGGYPMTTRPDVRFTKASYDYRTLKPAVCGMLEALTRNTGFTGAKVLIKPNLLMPAAPDRAVLTHPLIVRAVAEYILDRGGRPVISDSPAVALFAKTLKTGGYIGAFADLDVPFAPFEQSVKVDVGPTFGRIELSREVLEADVVVNLPKLKTHTQMGLTLGVKNLFGCVVGLRKLQWHLRCGIRKEIFAELLVRIHDTVRPAVTLVDGILALEGQGPGVGGTPRHIGVLVAGHSAHAVDAAICAMLHIDPIRVPTLQAARVMGVELDRFRIVGDLPTVENFRFPDPEPVMIGPRPFQRHIRRHVLQRPEPMAGRCRMCGECWKYCPVQAISHRIDPLRFDYDRCIRCYCCVELCPHGAMVKVEPKAGRLFRRAGDLLRTVRGRPA